MFTVVNLEENHRQGDDKSYADLLNRVRIGEHTDADLKILESQVRDKNDEELKTKKETYTSMVQIRRSIPEIMPC